MLIVAFDRDRHLEVRITGFSVRITSTFKIATPCRSRSGM
jgi:hypothetical protein